ncbi:hypothetical protein PHISP_08592, partial [Aspergillus sp. HF37]
ARRDRKASQAGRLCHRPPLSRHRGPRRSISGILPARQGCTGVAGREMGQYRLCPWCDEHRQHNDFGRDHRLR